MPWLCRSLIAISLTLLSACAGSGAGPFGIGAVIGDRNLAAVEPLFTAGDDKCLDSAEEMMALIYPDPDGSHVAEKSMDECTRIKEVFRRAVPSNASYTAPQRNEIMDILMAASNRKCGRYTAMLKSADGAWNSQMGILSILTGGLGSFVGGEVTAKALSGTSSILNGSRSAVNETLFTNQAIHVLSAAYEKSREAELRRITNRQACTTDQYSLSRGLQDVFNYHKSCSIVVGLYETAKAVERADSPGMDAMRLHMSSLISLRRQAEEFSKSGPPTPIAPARSESDRLAIVKANEAVRTAQDHLSTASRAYDEEIEKRKKLSEAEANSRERKATLENVTNNVSAKKHELQLKLEEFARIVQQVASGVTALSTVEPETRVCPYGLAVEE